MANPLKYIVDENGTKTTVLVPLKTWNNLNEKYQKLTHKLDVLLGIQEGLEEVKKSKANGRQLQTLRDFLNENDD